MSKIGRAPISIPANVELSQKDGVLHCKGPKGELSWKLPECITLEVTDGQAVLHRCESDDQRVPALWGLSRSLVQNMVTGVVDGFTKKLEIQGVGYRAKLQGKKLILSLGYSHEVPYEAPEGVDISVEDAIVTISGIDKQKVGQVAADIRAFRAPEPYKGKGVRYVGEHVRRKVGKTAAGSEG